jgi:hypothetical protein
MANANEGMSRWSNHWQRKSTIRERMKKTSKVEKTRILLLLKMLFMSLSF